MLNYDFHIMRNSAGTPFLITSGARCESHNKAVGGKENSAHVTGEAFDVKYYTSREAFLIEKAAYLAGINRIGRNRFKRFIHIDISTTLPQNVSFDY